MLVRSRWQWLPALAIGAALALLVFGSLTISRDRSREQHLIGELADLHVSTLASSSPVDVVSTDRHTVKPWFEGRIPFTFNLPELEGSPFAELIFRLRQHQISVFIFQERVAEGIHAKETASTELSFGIRSWTRRGLRYFVIGDASSEDLDKLSDLLKSST
jgi:anti-sigma factor RsiW